MPQPTRGDVHVNRPLTNISVAYLQQESDFVANRVFPTIPVSNKSDDYYVYDKKQWFRSDVKERAPGTESAGTGFTLSTASYNAKVYALHKDVDDQTRANQDAPLDLDRDATQLVMRQHLINKEIDFATKFMTTGVWGSDFTPGTLWSAGGSDPVKDVRAQRRVMKARTGYAPNTLIVSPDVDDILKDHTVILDRIKYTQRGMVTNDLLASLFEVQFYLVMEAVRDSNPEGAAESLGHLVTKDALLLYVEPNPGLLKPSAGYTFTWSGYTGMTSGTRMKKFRMEHLNSDRVEGEYSYDQKIVGSDLGIFFDGAIA